ncbi:MAG TPA: S8 family serine peptidase, partial [Kamptonema sp.]|nr:S8 family serine peptidase [Kamptonema sp.]
NQNDADPSPNYERTVIRKYLLPENIRASIPTNFPVKVPLTGVVTDVNVQLDIQHPKVSDLEGYLVSPEELMFDPLIFLSSSRNRSPRPGDPPSETPEAELFRNLQNGDSNFTGTTFDDEAITPIASAFAPFTGRFQPQGSLADVDNQWAPGSWQLRINDEAWPNFGTLNRIGLEFKTYNPHGTSVAGVAVANGSNGYQGSGVAPKASFAGLRLVADQFTDLDLANVFYDPSSKNRNQSIDIYNNSWKDEDRLSYFGEGVDAMEDGVKKGRGGLGNIYIFGGGNDALDGGNVNYNGLANSRYAIAVGAIDNRGYKSIYSEPGASLLVSAYSSGNGVGITTADIEGARGYDKGDYTTGFGGTSAAAPFVSGVVALMLEKNPSLSWRDVQHILVETAQQNDIYDGDWHKNGAGYLVNHKYGFGAINPLEAVKKAADWTPVDREERVTANYELKNVNEPIPNGGEETKLSSTIMIDEDINVEKVEVGFDIQHKDWNKLTVRLKSPDGTESYLLHPLPESINTNNNSQSAPQSSTPWLFTSNRDWGESSKGEWTLEVFDDNGNQVQGYWHSWKLNIYGTKPTLSVQATDANASENGDPGAVTITRNGNTKYDLKVNYSTGGTASEGGDYQGLSGNVTIPAGQSSVEIPIRILDDNSVEGEETARVTLSSGQDYTIGKDASATVAIADNDELPNVVTNTKDSGSGSLRAVLNWANSNPGKDTVIFKIPTTDPGYNSSTNNFTIQPLSALPQITDSVIIDGTTQPGFSERPVIELDGSNAAIASGLTITAGNSTVRGMAINRFSLNGISLQANGGNFIEGNYIGTDVTGTKDLGNSETGLGIVNSSNNTIGGTVAQSRNLISGNERYGIEIGGFSPTNNIIIGNYIGTDVTGTKDLDSSTNGIGVGIRSGFNNIVGGTNTVSRNIISGNNVGVHIDNKATNNLVQGNYIGTDITGTQPIGNLYGVGISGVSGISEVSNNTIGGATDGARNIISGNNSMSIIVGPAATGTKVQGNYIGTDVTGTKNLGNGGYGVIIYGRADNLIGGTGAKEGNTIAFNYGGIQMVGGGSDGSNILSNSIFSNTKLGIDIGGGDFVTPNDLGDTDTYQNFPELTSAISSSGNTIVKGKINSTPNTNLRVELFSNTVLDDSGGFGGGVFGGGGYGEGEKFVGFQNVTTDSSGNATFAVNLPLAVPVGQFVTATATDPNNNTSEFSQGIVIEAQPTEPFTDIGVSLTNLGGKSVKWGDYDSDGNLDILLTGHADPTNQFNNTAKVYRNLGNGNFVDINAALTGVTYGDSAWGDYDNDGDLDILLTGTGASGVSITKIYRNDLGSFTDINASLPSLWASSAKWGDYDNDGDLDILLIGYVSPTGISKIYRNDGGSFIDINAPLVGTSLGAANWGDYDKDGDLDILLSGYDGANYVSKVYQNQNGNFVDIAAPLTNIYGESAWGDYDNDGDLDILLSGRTSNQWPNVAQKTFVYRNDNGSFTDIGLSLPSFDGFGGWGDYDNDGDLDILLTGSYGAAGPASVYRNDSGGSFTYVTDFSPNIGSQSATWGDYDRDGDLDVLFTSISTASSPTASKIYRNNVTKANTLPTTPTGINASVNNNYVTLSWNPATDAETPQKALTYNLRVGTTPGGSEIMSPMANSNGTRKVVQMGNVNQNTNWTLKNLKPGTYYWSTQAIDTAFEASTFAPEGTFTVLGTGAIGVVGISAI